MSLFFAPSEPDIERKVGSLQLTPGYCVFVDIAGSTRMKDEALYRWASKIYNAFVRVQMFMPAGSFPLKSMGDALLYFIPKRDLCDGRQHGVARVLHSRPDARLPLRLFAGLASVVDDPDPIFPEQKAAVVSGAAYELTFIRDRPDVYGKDVDLAAQLSSKACSRQVVMNRAFYDEVVAEFNCVGPGGGFDEVNWIESRGTVSLKGFDAPIELFSYGR
jgi:class 3 adenylate cyclase